MAYKYFKGSYNWFAGLVMFIIKAYITGLLIFFLYRVIFIVSFGKFADLMDFKADFFQSFITGFRFDTIVLTYGYCLLFFISFFSFLMPAHRPVLKKIIDKFYVVFSTIVLSVFIIICFVDYYYYKFFTSHINVSFFGIVDDDTHALFKSIWTDYPVIKISLAMLILVILLAKLFNKLIINKLKINPASLAIKILFVVLIIVVYGLGMRCSFGVVPLKYEEASISPNTFINNITMNSVFALKNAMEERNSSRITTDVNVLLKQYGYPDLLSAVRDFTGEKTGSTDIFGLFTDSVPKNTFLEKNPPNIVFILMESMGNYFNQLHTDSFNTMGQLANEIPNCIVFDNFLSARELTIYTLESILINSPQSPISQSEYLKANFSSTSALKPFVESGYVTTFVTGGRNNWRNLDQFLPQQGFQYLEDGAEIKRNVLNAGSEHEWGVYDEFLFDRLYQKLADTTKKKQFIMALSISNHTPYKVPDGYKPFLLHISIELEKKLSYVNEYVLDNFLCHQYSNHQLGIFISKVRHSTFGDNTIIIATGDHASHNTSNFFKFGDKNLLQRHGVPLIAYIPEKYKPSLFIDLKRFGSHKDIFPTLYHLALSGKKYFKSGANLFGPKLPSDHFALFKYNLAMNPVGCILFDGNPVFLKWDNTPNKELIFCTGPSVPSLSETGKKAKAYSFLMNYILLMQIGK